MNEMAKMRIEDVDTPALMLDADALERNLARMQGLAAAANSRFATGLSIASAEASTPEWV